jgi:threonine dehydratase
MRTSQAHTTIGLVIDGNATLGEELSERNFDIIVVPIGGGGLDLRIVTGLGRKGTGPTVVGAEPLSWETSGAFLEGWKDHPLNEPMTIADGGPEQYPRRTVIGRSFAITRRNS